ncbi:alkaline phosphatase family protein [Oceanobacillus damuensis]|uniref:alkaline phosphatase family protein n=1 Tax=Oceanobacillus damuensis TaxID=937928 RepID=UPI0008361AC5|nr:alkaline phosphatase family protein [Oceanobacillus damuensis]
MLKKSIIALLSFSLILFAVIWFGFSSPANDLSVLEVNNTSKPVVLMLIDSLMDEPLQKAMEEGRTPALEFLADQGRYLPQIVTSYPTMSVTIDSTLLTGTYANHHMVPALAWYNLQENRLVNYGSSAMEIFQLGVDQVLYDSIHNLNHEHLSKDTTTIFEEMDSRQLDSGSINGMVYRGNQRYDLNIPTIISVFNILPETVQVKGPTVLSLGSLSQFNSENEKHNNVWQRLGMNDSFTANELKKLIQNDKLPSFTLAYFPGLDKKVHKNGPMEMEGIEAVDQEIQSILNEFPSWEDAIENVTVIVYGDSGQAIIADDEQEALIDLRVILENYQIAELGKPIQAKDQVVLAVNSRMAYVHLLDENINFTELLANFTNDSRIGFIAWKDDTGNHVVSQNPNSKFTFKPNGNYTDQYDQEWELEGDPSILDITMDEQSIISYGEYPDALARLYGALHSHEGRYIIVDAKPGHEFIGEHSPTHPGGGGHGSLHKDDSLTPMIITGDPSTPQYERVVDFKDWILELTD